MHVTTIKQDRHGNNLHVVYIGFLALLNLWMIETAKSCAVE